MGGIIGGIEQIHLAMILRVDQRVRASDPVREPLRIGPAFEPLPVRAGRRRQIAVAQVVPGRPGAGLDQRGNARAVSAGRGAVDPGRRLAERPVLEIPRDARERIDIARLLPPADRPDHGVEHRDLRLERVAEQAGDAERHVHAGTAQPVHRDDLEAGHPVGPLAPHRFRADQHQRQREVLAAGAHGGAAPQIDHQRSWPVALFLKVAADDLVGGAPRENHGRTGRHRARVDGEHVAAGGKHVAPASGRRAGRSGLDEPAVERIEQRLPFRCRAGVEPGFQIAGKVIGDVSQQRVQQRRATPGRGDPAEDVQPVPDLEVLHVAQIGIEPGQPVVLGHVGARPAFLQQSQRVSAVQNIGAQQRGAPLVEAVGAGVFVDQPLQFQRGTVRSGGFQRRGQVSDGDRAQPPLRGRRLARVVDDEGIGHRDAAQQRRREAGFRHRDRFAGQPFERPVRAQMDHRVDVLDAAQPKVKRDVSVARRHVGVVIERLTVEDLAAVRLNRGDEASEAGVAKEKRSFLDRGIVFRRSPDLGNPCPGLFRERPEQPAIGRNVENRARRRVAEGGDEIERRRVRRHVVAGFPQQRHDFHAAFDRVEANGVGELARRRVIGQHHSDPPFAARSLREANPARRLFRGERDTPRIGRVARAGIFQPIFPLVLGLE